MNPDRWISDGRRGLDRAVSFRGQFTEEGRRSAADGGEAHQRRDTVNGLGRRDSKLDEAHMASLTERSASSGDHRRRPATRGTVAESSPDSEKKAAPVHGFDWALA